MNPEDIRPQCGDDCACVAPQRAGAAMREFQLRHMPVMPTLCTGCELPAHLCDCDDTGNAMPLPDCLRCFDGGEIGDGHRATYCVCPAGQRLMADDAAKERRAIYVTFRKG